MQNDQAKPQLVLILLMLASILPELALQGSDHNIWGAENWRLTAYSNGAFWTGLLYGWTPNYPQQPHLMFLSYAFLHADLSHMMANMITLYVIGRSLLCRVGWVQFSSLYLISILGGALGYVLLSNTPRPMVGASGALFGLIGAWVIWNVSDTLYRLPGLETFFYVMLWPVVLLILLNLVMYWAASGNLAWQTHLGGAIAGAIAAPLLYWSPPGKTK